MAKFGTLSGYCLQEAEAAAAADDADDDADSVPIYAEIEPNKRRSPRAAGQPEQQPQPVYAQIDHLLHARLSRQ